MNDPTNVPIDEQAMFDWLRRYKDEKHLSWPALGRLAGVPHSTMSAWYAPSFQGNRAKAAALIYSLKQKVESQEARATTALSRPEFIETETANGLIYLMEWAQGGRITAAAMGPGTGKTMAADHYKASIGATVWKATMRQSTRSVTAMIAQVMRAMGLTNASGWAQQRSGQIEQFVRGKQGLLIVDEANHLEWAALEEIRAWHDETGLGVCLLGNEELLERIRGGAKSHAYARLNRRIAHFHLQDLPLESDINAYLDAMQIDDPAMRRPLVSIALTPGHGGLGEVQQILESAHMLAITAEEVLELPHIEKAIRGRTIDARRRRAA